MKTDRMVIDNQPKWAVISEEEESDFNSLLELAAQNYRHHTGWFVQQKDSGVKNQAVLITAEVALTSLSLSKEYYFPAWLAVVSLMMLATLSPILAIASIKSCKRSYVGSLENALLVTKTLWAMGMLRAIKVKPEKVDFDNCPVVDDETIYISRYINDANRYTSTEDFVERHIKLRRNTFTIAKLTIGIFGAVGCAIGVVGAIIVTCG